MTSSTSPGPHAVFSAGAQRASTRVMDARAWMSIVMALGIVVVVSACGDDDASEAGSPVSSGGPSGTSSGGASSTSGGGAGTSSGAYDCSPPFNSYAKATFEEDNTSDRLRGITVESCQGSACAVGTLTQAEAGPGYWFELTTESQAVNASALVTTLPDGKLRFEMVWTVPYDAPKEATAQTGETFSVKGYFAGDGANTFEHSFIGTCTKELCGMFCKLAPKP